jgi:hypothetical protein
MSAAANDAVSNTNSRFRHPDLTPRSFP